MQEKAGSMNGNLWGTSLEVVGDMGFGRMQGIYGVTLSEIPYHREYRD